MAYTQINGQTVLFPTIQFRVSHLLAHSLNVWQFCLTHRYDPIRCYHSKPEWTLEQWQWSGTQHSALFLDRSLIIRWFSIIYQDTHWRGLIPQQRCSWFILQPLQPTGQDGLVSYWRGMNSYPSAEMQSQLSEF